MLIGPRALLSVGLLLCWGCNVQPPGELLGEYAVRGMLLENTCGNSALPAADPLNFRVQVRHDGLSALWLHTPPARAGTLDEHGRFEFQIENIFHVNPNQVLEPPDPFTTDPGAFVDEEMLTQAFDPAAAQASSCTLVIVERMVGRLRRDLGGPVGEEMADDDAPVFDLSGDNEIEIRAATGGSCELVKQQAGGPFEALPCLAHYAIEGDLLEPEE